MELEELSRCPEKFSSACQMSRIAPSHINTLFLSMREKIGRTVGENMYRCRTAINSKEYDKERKMCRLVIIVCGLGLRKTRKGHVKENQQEK